MAIANRYGVDLNYIPMELYAIAHLKSEQNGVPADRIELRHRYDNKVLVLRKGENLIKIFDGENSIEYGEYVE